ncbi:hypothetical protein [Bathymodiolus japonicus methanotrophic gill symbiont]|uniref:hypothetical protein n=1 Tax=Bathymodiolus japonicus methanotrophic gill symbiont TaxID=113269 RepID=UPI001C8DA465|nr:hypothetical protein [Bathymodiolus japonicus methanotrophic gill symbiont]
MRIHCPIIPGVVRMFGNKFYMIKAAAPARRSICFLQGNNIPILLSYRISNLQQVLLNLLFANEDLVGCLLSAMRDIQDN